jgi:hypothetical protein
MLSNSSSDFSEAVVNPVLWVQFTHEHVTDAIVELLCDHIQWNWGVVDLFIEKSDLKFTKGTDDPDSEESEVNVTDFSAGRPGDDVKIATDSLEVSSNYDSIHFSSGTSTGFRLNRGLNCLKRYASARHLGAPRSLSNCRRFHILWDNAQKRGVYKYVRRFVYDHNDSGARLVGVSSPAASEAASK